MNTAALLFGAAFSLWWVDPYGDKPYLPDSPPDGGVVTNVPSVTRYNGIQVLLGNGEIVGDGEGTARTLDCLNFYQVTNALAGVSGNTNGWRAVNKGMVVMPPSFVFGSGTAMSGAKCVGCDMGLARPNLVNAVRVEVARAG